MVGGKAPGQYMFQEIMEQPEAIDKTIRESEGSVERASELLDERFIYVTGSGTSYHASLVLQRALMRISGKRATAIQASELPNWMPSRAENSSLIAFSQSGESKDVLIAVESFRKVCDDCPVIAITNTEGSTLARVSDQVIFTKAGVERAVAATKSYTTQLAAAYMLSVKLSKDEELMKKLRSIPRVVREVIEGTSGHVEPISEFIKDREFGFVLGKGANYPTALEAALKLRETCNFYYTGFAAREFLHGPIQLVNEKTPVIAVDWRSIGEVLRKVSSYGAPVIRVGQGGDLPAPDLGELSPIVMIVPLQLLAYHVSVKRGLDPDKPEKLGKVVTE